MLQFPAPRAIVALPCKKTTGNIMRADLTNALKGSESKKLQNKSSRTANPSLVFVGADGNCFLQNDSNRVMQQHAGEMLFSPDIIALWQESLLRRTRFLRQRGAEHMFVLGPDKQSVFWPTISGGKPDHRNYAAVFTSALDEVTWVDPTAALAAATSSHRIYPLTDSHWDMRGAYIAYRSVMERSERHKAAILQEGIDFAYFPKIVMGDLGNKFVPPKTSESERISRIQMTAKLVYSNGVSSNGGIHVYQKKGLINVGMLIGDSYTQNLAPYFAEHFGLFVHMRGTHFDTEFIGRIGPETVVSEATERFMCRAPVLADDEPTEIIIIRKIALGEIRERGLNIVRQKYANMLLYLPFPPPLVAMIARQVALSDVILNRDGPPSEAQARFLFAIFEDAMPADVLVAIFIAKVRAQPAGSGWLEAYQSLPTSVRLRFERAAEGKL